MANTTMTVRLSGTLGDVVTANIGKNGAYENVSEYIRDLIQRNKERKYHQSFERLKSIESSSCCPGKLLCVIVGV